MAGLDRQTARALAEAGYMPLDVYLATFGDEAPLAPEIADDPHDAFPVADMIAVEDAKRPLSTKSGFAKKLGLP